MLDFLQHFVARILDAVDTAGCVLAYRLTADPSIRVLLLEAGGRECFCIECQKRLHLTV